MENNGLVILKVNVKDRGEYICKAKNVVFSNEPRSRPIKIVVHSKYLAIVNDYVKLFFLCWMHEYYQNYAFQINKGFI